MDFDFKKIDTYIKTIKELEAHSLEFERYKIGVYDGDIFLDERTDDINGMFMCWSEVFLEKDVDTFKEKVKLYMS